MIFHMETFLIIAVGFGLIMLIWDCVEVGRNDAANLVNAVFGARVMRRKTALYVAGIAVILGATCATPVMETVRKGIFDPTMLTLQAAIIVYISVYIVDTILLYAYSSFGMPVSTTAMIVFELLGAALGVHIGINGGGIEIVQWAKVSKVIQAILLSILLSGIAGFLIQRIFRGAIRDRIEDRETLLLHGPWISGLIMTMLLWFMLMKGMKGFGFIKELRVDVFDKYGTPAVLLVVWGIMTLIIHLVLTFGGRKSAKYLFHVTAIIGMLCMAFAFGQNDLANCASPGIASYILWHNSHEGVEVATGFPIPIWTLFVCGLLMFTGMMTKKAQRVTRAAVNTGSQYDHVALWAPEWCRKIARTFVKPQPELIAPPVATTEKGKKIHYDTLRASVIMAVSASVIAFASGKGLPVSTTYVAFAAVVATGWGDRIFSRGDADLKMGRAIWVVTAWFLAALIAALATAIVARIILHLAYVGLVLGVAANLGLRVYFSRRSARHEKQYHLDYAKKAGLSEEEAKNEENEEDL